MRFKIQRRTTVLYNMLAGASFLGLAIWHWQLPVASVILYFFLSVFFLLLLVGFAALVGMVLSKLRSPLDFPLDDLDCSEDPELCEPKQNKGSKEAVSAETTSHLNDDASGRD